MSPKSGDGDSQCPADRFSRAVGEGRTGVRIWPGLAHEKLESPWEPGAGGGCRAAPRHWPRKHPQARSSQGTGTAHVVISLWPTGDSPAPPTTPYPQALGSQARLSVQWHRVSRGHQDVNSDGPLFSHLYPLLILINISEENRTKPLPTRLLSSL